jgi:hypothetical protein
MRIRLSCTSVGPCAVRSIVVQRFCRLVAGRVLRLEVVWFFWTAPIVNL